jgi:hypothetical protein
MFDAKITLANITDKFPYIYNTNERWVVKKMRSKYVNKNVVIFPLFIIRIRCNIFAINML